MAESKDTKAQQEAAADEAAARDADEQQEAAPSRNYGWESKAVRDEGEPAPTVALAPMVPPVSAAEKQDSLRRAMIVAQEHATSGDRKPAAGDFLWVMSNRVDDRAVLWERDQRHPGGEVFVGGDGVIPAYRTPAIRAKLNNGEIVEVPPPSAESRRFPHVEPAKRAFAATPPGRPVRLGRHLDHDLYPDEGQRRSVERKQQELPEQIEVPEGVVVPTDKGARESTAASRR